MPGYRTHYLFGRETLNHFYPDSSQQFLVRHTQAYQLGLQGPDVFFYHIPLYLGHDRNIGNIMHGSNTLSFIQALISTRNHLVHKKDRQIADAYICGYIGHYTLDCYVHPYVFYRTNYLDHIDDSNFDFANHVSLETDIDDVMYRHITHTKPTDLKKPGDLIKLPIREHAIISGLLFFSLRKVFPEERIHLYSIRHSIDSMRICQNLMHDPTGRVKIMLRAGEQLIMKQAFISTQVPSDTLCKFKDPCNIKHKKWKNPFAEDAAYSTESVYQLMEKAEKCLIERINLYSAALYPSKDESDEQVFHNLTALYEEIGDNSFESGYPL